MDPIETVSEIETLYRKVLELTRKQENCLRSGDFATLPSLLEEKARSVTKARALTTGLQALGHDPSSPEFQSWFARIGAALAEAVRAEERCSTLAPSRSSKPSRSQAIAAYTASRRSG